MKKFWLRKGLMFLLFFLAGILLMSALVMLLWNNILYPVLGISLINYPQAIGILVLCKILFGRFGPGGNWRRGGGPPWRKNIQQKWAAMTPEQRAEFKEKWRNKKYCRDSGSQQDQEVP